MMKMLRVLTLCCLILAFNAQSREKEAEVNLQQYARETRPTLSARDAAELRDIAYKLQILLIGFVHPTSILKKVTAETVRLHAAFKDLAPITATQALITQLTQLRDRMRTGQQKRQLDGPTQGAVTPQEYSSNNVQEQPSEPVYTITDRATGEVINVKVHPEMLRDSEFLDEHNFYRRRLRDGTDPDGTHVPGLADLIWDEALAEECEKWAKTCVYQYAQNIACEENLASTVKLIGDPVQLWYEYRRKTEHYRKMVSPTAVYLGCYMNRCDVLQLVAAGVNQTHAYYTVCRYSTTKTTPKVPTE
ncbi:hypothetical protein CSKR_108635 [Clonorchis sinensis]|uniref:SCP domain-containing protein n=1 Tax=Clonorchis sinensis TaxID=79923 RepID=A0A8T1ME15_CLOSI|nr:hypothetical protein CSKR_108635 [Clonorchis sinensis]